MAIRAALVRIVASNHLQLPLMGVAAFLASGLLLPAREWMPTWSPLLVMAAAAVLAVSLLGFAVGLACLGTWVGQRNHALWLERHELRASKAGLAHAVAILGRARAQFWAGIAVAAPTMFLLPLGFIAIGDSDDAGFIVVLPVFVIAATTCVRAAVLLADGRRSVTNGVRETKRSVEA